MMPSLIQQYFDAFARRDVVTLKSLFSEDVTLQDPVIGRVMGRDNVLEVYSEMFATCPSWDLSLRRVYSAGDHAVAVEFLLTIAPATRIAGVDLIDFGTTNILGIRAYLDQSSSA